MKSPVGRCLVANDSQQLARLRERSVQAPNAVEEPRFRPPGAPHPPGRLRHRLHEQLLASIPRRQVRPELHPQPLELLGVLVEHHRRPRGQPVPERVPARCCLARGGPGPGAPQGIAAVGGDLSGSGHGSLAPVRERIAAGAGGHPPSARPVLLSRSTGGLNNRQRPSHPSASACAQGLRTATIPK